MYINDTCAPVSAAAVVSVIVALAVAALEAAVTALTDTADPSWVTAKSPIAGSLGDHTASLSVSVAAVPSYVSVSIVGAVASTARDN